MYVYYHNFAGIKLLTESDVQIPHLQKNNYKKFVENSFIYDACQCIYQYDLNSINLPPLDVETREYLSRTVGFVKHWFDKPILNFDKVRQAILSCSSNPEMVYINLTWNRAIIRDFAHNKFFLFYPPERKKSFSQKIFLAGYRNLFCDQLLNFDSILIHGAGVIYNNKGLVFLASDEGGKSTAASLFSSGDILNDDQIILKREESEITVHSTPFGNMGCGPKKIHLNTFFLLEKSLFFELIPLRPRDILKFLWDEHMYRWFNMPKSHRIRAFSILERACNQAICYKMRFPKDFVDWNTIDKVLSK
jgi:hypothetical protein